MAKAGRKMERRRSRLPTPSERHTMNRGPLSTTFLAVVLAGSTGDVAAQRRVAADTDIGTGLAMARAATVAPAPFGPGERVEYGVTYGFLGRRGTAVSQIVGVDTLRGHPSYHLSFHLRGGVLGFNINDHQESWLDIANLYSHRFRQDLDQPRYERLRTLDFYPADMVWRRVEKEESGPLATDQPLDDVSFLYWSRTLPLEVGRTYTFPRYFKAEGNPVTIQVLRKQQVTVPFGTFNTIVVRPLIRTDGLFSEGGEAEVYYTDDWRRLIVLVKTKMPFAEMEMRLENYTAGKLLGQATNTGRQ